MLARPECELDFLMGAEAGATRDIAYDRIARFADFNPVYLRSDPLMYQLADLLDVFVPNVGVSSQDSSFLNCDNRLSDTRTLRNDLHRGLLWFDC